MRELLKRLRHDVSGATALEYGLILCLMVVAIAAGLTALGQENRSQWNLVSSQVSSAVAYATS